MEKRLIIDHIRDVNKNIKLHPDAQKAVEDMVDIIYADSKILSDVTALYGAIWATKNYSHDKIKEIADRYELDFNLLSLFFAEYLSIGTKEMYIQNGWGLNTYYDNLLDIEIWAKVCFDRTGKWGLIEYGWIFCSLIADVIRLGRLQFQMYNTYEQALPITISGITVNEGDRVINIHIPEGDAITKEKRMDSYRRAYKFFNQTGHAVFMCHSWLISPRNKEILPETSNIVSFVNDFNIVSTGISNGDMWRVFGTAWPPKDDNYDLLPQDTGIRKAYVKELKNGSKLGAAVGFFVFDGKNIIS